jgi:hypothetical protein
MSAAHHPVIDMADYESFRTILGSHIPESSADNSFHCALRAWRLGYEHRGNEARKMVFDIETCEVDVTRDDRFLDSRDGLRNAAGRELE